jgi:hypothetical protein
VAKARLAPALFRRDVAPESARAPELVAVATA